MSLFINQALVALLKADAGVKDQCGGRVFRGHAAQTETRTRITYRCQSGVEFETLGGPTGTVRSHYELHCWGGQETPGKDAEYLADAVRRCINGTAAPTGAKYPTTWAYKDAASGDDANVKVQYAKVVDAEDWEEPPPDGSERFPEAVKLEIEILWDRS